MDMDENMDMGKDMETWTRTWNMDGDMGTLSMET
jgi:hypothetical protein